MVRRSAGLVSGLCLAVVCCCLAVLWAPTSAQVAITSRDFGSSHEITPAGAVHVALPALSVGVAGGLHPPRRVQADDLGVVRAGSVDEQVVRPSALGRRMGLQGGHPRDDLATAPDAGPDAGSRSADAGLRSADAGLPDAGLPDAGLPDAGLPDAEAEPERAAATRLGRGAGGTGGAGSSSAVAPGGQGGSGAAILCAVTLSADGAGYRLAPVDTRPAELQSQARPLVRPG